MPPLKMPRTTGSLDVAVSTMGRMVERVTRVVAQDQERADLFAQFPSGTWVTVTLPNGEQLLDRTRGGVLLINGRAYVAIESRQKAIPLEDIKKAYRAWVRLTRPRVVCRWVDGIWKDRDELDAEIDLMRVKYPDIMRVEVRVTAPPAE